MRKQYRPIRASPAFVKELEEIKLERIKAGRDNAARPKGFDRFTLAIKRHNLWNNIKSDIIKSELKDENYVGLRPIRQKKQFNKRGSAFDYLVWMIIGFVTIILLGTLLYFSTKFVDVFHSIPLLTPDTPQVNFTNINSQTVDKFSGSLTVLRTIGTVILIGGLLSILISNFFIKSHPVFFVFYLLILLVIFIASIPISNAYQSLTQGPSDLSTQIKSQPGVDWIFVNLPAVTIIMGLLGLVLLFINYRQDTGLEGGFG